MNKDALKIAIQMDPIADIDIQGDTSFALGLAAQARGHKLFYYEPSQLCLHNENDTCVLAPLQALTLADKQGAHFTLGQARMTDLRTLDVILMRQDPPFNMAYITASYFLDMLQPDVLVVNNPTSVRNAPEKLFPLQFKGLAPPTLITRDHTALTEFRATYKDIILKPLYGNGGAGVLRIKGGDENFNALLDMYLTSTDEPIIAQQYLPAVKDGDKRILLVEGEAVGALNRRPPAGDVRANLRAGGTAEATTLTPRDLEIVEQLAPTLRAMGIIFAGIDVIGDYLTEINITSPTCVRQFESIVGVNLAIDIWQAIEARLQKANKDSR
ncbi:MAG: glutathione synthase [Alphaproteobacteria bacterium]|nr:glutathione synthase [Alphaproteobacteria bacterium]